MATFGPIASAMPNVLYSPMAVDAAVQGRQRNQLMMDNARQDQAQQTFQRDATARIGMARELSALPEQEAASQWGSYRQRLQAAGLGQGLPEQFPGLERLKAVASSDLTTFQRMQIDEKRRQTESWAGMFGGGAPAMGGPGAGTAPVQPGPAAPGAPVSAPGGNMYGRNADAAIARDALLDQPPVVLAAASSARAAQSGLPTNAPYRDGATWAAGIAPPTGAVPAITPPAARSAAPAAPALQLDQNGLTPQNLAALRMAGPERGPAMMLQMQQQNRMEVERARDNARADAAAQRQEQQFSIQQQQQLVNNERADAAAKRADETARRQAEAADRAARAEERRIEQAANPGPSAADRTKLNNIETEAAGIRDALNTFVQTRATASTGDRVASAAGMSTSLNTSYNNAALLAKGEALYNLGVLNGPDLDIIRRTLADPGTIRGGLLTDQKTVREQADQIQRLLEQRLAAARRQYGGTRGEAGPGAAPGAVAGPTAGSTAEPPAAPAPGSRPPLSSFGR